MKESESRTTIRGLAHECSKGLDFEKGSIAQCKHLSDAATEM
jgi:hypothetical protein